MLEDCLGWTDVSNNKAFMSEQISCTNNAESILWFAKRTSPTSAKVTDQAHEPEGAEGPLPHARTRSAIRSSLHTKDQKAAKDFLRWLMEPKQAGPLVRRRRSPTTSRSCTPTTTRRCGTSSRATCPTAMRSKTAHLPGWPAPLSREQSESVAKFVVVDMFAKACAGKSTKEVIADAAGAAEADLQVGLSG